MNQNVYNVIIINILIKYTIKSRNQYDETIKQ